MALRLERFRLKPQNVNIIKMALRLDRFRLEPQSVVIIKRLFLKWL
jgi:hypothetical protein